MRLRELAARWCDAATLDRYVDPVLADLQAEYEDAVRRGRAWQSRWIWIRGHVAFFTTIVRCGGGQIVDVSDGDRTALRRTAVWCSAITIAVTLVVAVAPVRSLVEAGRSDAVRLAIYLVPSVLPLSIPLGLTLGLFWGMGRSGVSRGSRVVVLVAAAAVSAALMGVLGWLAPSSNQAYRVAIFEPRGANEFTLGELPKGTNEMTLGELRRMLRSPGNDPMYLPDDIANVARNYYRRWALAFAPIVLSLFALVVIGRGHRSAVLLTTAAFAAVSVYFMLAAAARILDGELPAFAVAWIPNAVFFSAAMVGILMRSPRSTPVSA